MRDDPSGSLTLLAGGAREEKQEARSEGSKGLRDYPIPKLLNS